MCFTRSEGRLCYMVLKPFADRTFCDQNSFYFPRLFAGIIKTFLHKIESGLKSSTNVVNLAHAVQLKFSKDYKTWLTKIWTTLAAFLPVEFKNREFMRVARIGAPCKLVYRYLTSQIRNAGESIEMTAATGLRKKIAGFASIYVHVSPCTKIQLYRLIFW